MAQFTDTFIFAKDAVEFEKQNADMCMCYTCGFVFARKGFIAHNCLEVLIRDVIYDSESLHMLTHREKNRKSDRKLKCAGVCVSKDTMESFAGKLLKTNGLKISGLKCPRPHQLLFAGESCPGCRLKIGTPLIDFCQS